MLNLKMIKNSLVFPVSNRWGNALENWVSTNLLLSAMKNPPIYSRYASGFLHCTQEEMLSYFSLTNNLFLDRGGVKQYATESIFFVTEKGAGTWFEFTLLTSDKKVANLFDEFKDKLVPRKENTVNVLTQGQNGIEVTPLEAVNSPIIKDNYIKEIAQKYDVIVNELQSDDPAGRLVIINGPPGSGKTYLIKGLIQELMNSTILILPANLVSSMDGPNLLTTFISHKRYHKCPMTLIIEDADSCLVPRMSDNMSAVSTLLNCADGILGSILDLRIIATTNQKKIKFDEALTRNGRMLKSLNIVDLPIEQANKVYRRLTDTDIDIYNEPKLLADIYAEAKGKSNNSKATLQKKTSPIGFGAKSFDVKPLEMSEDIEN